MPKEMKNYNVFFELYGKKLKKKILASNSEEANEKIKDAIIFHKTELDVNDEFNEAMDLINGFNDLLKNIK